MQVSRIIPRSVLAAVAVVAVATPVAGAVPMYDSQPRHPVTGEAYDVNRETGAYTPANASADMHASTVGSAFEKSVTATDLRTEAAKSPIQSTRVGDDLPAGGDLRTEAAKSPIQSTRVGDDLPAGSDLRSEAARDAQPRTPVGMPTWPVDPQPIVPPGPEPVAATDGGDGSFDWPLAGLIAGAAFALLGAALVAGRQLRGHTRPAH